MQNMKLLYPVDNGYHHSCYNSGVLLIGICLASFTWKLFNITGCAIYFEVKDKSEFTWINHHDCILGTTINNKCVIDSISNTPNGL